MGLLLAILKNLDMWHLDADLKYLNIRLDTRDGHFLLFDRDNKEISPDQVYAAIDTVRARRHK